MEQGPGAELSKAPQEEEAEPQQKTLTQAISGHGQVLLIKESWKQEECCITLQDFLAQIPSDELAGPSSTGDASPNRSSSTCATRGRKRSGDHLAQSSDGPAAKAKRSAEEPASAERACADSHELKAPPPPPPPGTPSSTAAQNAGPGQEPGAELLLVMCRASALGTTLPRLQLLLQQVLARTRRAPAALVGILVQPRPDEEAEARGRLESLLCGVFAPRRPVAEVHTAVFCPGRPQGALDVRRAACQTHRVPLVDRETQTDGGVDD